MRTTFRRDPRSLTRVFTPLWLMTAFALLPTVSRAQTDVNTGFSGTIADGDIINLIAPGGTVNGAVTNNGELWFNNPAIATQTINSAITGTGLVVFWQPVTVDLAGANSYSGGTFLYDGTTIVSGSLTGDGAIELDGNPGTLFRVSGTVESGQTILGFTSGSHGDAEVTAGSWTSASELYAGFGGTSVVTVSGGTLEFGTIYFGNSIGSSGTLNLSGGEVSTSGSGIGYFGYNGSSTVTVSGGTLSTGGDLYFSYLNSATATLSGTGTISAAGTLFVGKEGTGSLTVNGGTLSSASGVIGQTTNGVGTVTMNASTWTVTNDLAVGQTTGGDGTLVLSGGDISAARLFVGRLEGSDGEVTVSDASSSLTLNGSFPDGNLLVGNAGTGIMTVSAGSVSAAGGSVGFGPTGDGTLTVSGGEVGVTGLLNIGKEGSGSLELSSGTLTTGQVIVGSDVFLSTSATGTVDVTGGNWNNSLSLTVGQNGTGTYTQSAGTVNVAGNSFIGSANTAATTGTGSVTVTGGTLAYAGNLDVGNAQPGSTGSGTLTVGTAGLVSVDGTLSRSVTAATGTIDINAGGTLSIGTGGTTGTLATDIADNDGLLIFNRSTDYEYPGIIGGSGGVRKEGSSILTLAGISTYSGPTTVTAGTLNLTGELGTTEVTVQSGATLTGTGSVLGNVVIGSGGTISPGAAAGSTLTVGTGTLQSSALAVLDITGADSSLYDSIAAQTGANWIWGNGAVSIAMSTTSSYAEGTSFDLFSGFSTYSGTLAGITFNGTGTDYAGLTFSDAGGGLWTTGRTAGNQFLEFDTGTGVLMVVPEPSGLLMVAGLGLTAMGFFRQAWRRRGVSTVVSRR